MSWLAIEDLASGAYYFFILNVEILLFSVFHLVALSLFKLFNV